VFLPQVVTSDIAGWFLDLKSVKKLASYKRVELVLSNFNKVFGNRIVNTIKPVDLEDYQNKREEDGRAPATIDMEISIVKTMITKAFDNDMVDGHTVKAFRKVKRKLRKAANARKRIISAGEYLKLREGASQHLKGLLTVAYNTGMRSGELRSLCWSHVDRDKGFTRLPAETTKERKAKNIPMNDHVRELFGGLPRAIHHDFVFTFQGEPIRAPGGLKKSFATACKNAGIPCGRKVADGIIFHDIRRTVKTNMVKAGVDKVYRDVILGHSLQGMDAHYMAPTEADLQGAMERYTQWLDGELVAAEAKIRAQGEGNVG
jgi:integrase